MTVAVPVLLASAVMAPALAGAASASAVAPQVQSPSPSTVNAQGDAETTVESRVQHFQGGGVTVSGRKWLQGKGVAVIRSRQCTDLATRLYAQKHWGSLNNIYGMKQGRRYGGGTIGFHRNGSGYVPVPGDVLVELGGSYQHVAVVDHVKKGKIFTFEQNAVPSGRHIYRWNGKTAKGAYGPRHVGGFIHSSKNRFKNPVA